MLFYSSTREQPHGLSERTLHPKSDPNPCGVRHRTLQGSALDGPVLRRGAQGHGACRSLLEMLGKAFGPAPEGSGPSTDGSHQLSPIPGTVISGPRGKNWC